MSNKPRTVAHKKKNICHQCRMLGWLPQPTYAIKNKCMFKKNYLLAQQKIKELLLTTNLLICLSYYSTQ